MALLACLLFWNWRALERGASSPPSFQPVVLEPIERSAPVRVSSLKNLFGLQIAAQAPKVEAPPEEEDGQTEANTPTHTVRLDGIILTGGKKIAVLLLSPKGKPNKNNPKKPEWRKVMEGGELLDFVVQKIESHRIVLYCPKRNEQVKLVIFKQNATEG